MEGQSFYTQYKDLVLHTDHLDSSICVRSMVQFLTRIESYDLEHIVEWKWKNKYHLRWVRL